MKKNDYVLLSAIGAYSFLFSEQDAGINFLIFSLVLIVLLLIKNKTLINDAKWCWAVLMVVFSGVCIFVHSSALSILANIFSLLLLSAFSINSKTSSILGFCFSVYSIFSSLIWMILDAINRERQSKLEPASNKNYKWLGIIVVTIVTILFFILYKNSNPLFAEYTKWINFDFITITWVFFTIGGTFLMYAFFYHRTIPLIENWENELKTSLDPKTFDENQQKKLDTQRVSIIILFSLLNLMLLVINIGDFNTLLLGGALPKGIKHSDFVHNGVGALIFSIVLAIGIIMLFLRGNLNFVKGNGIFKMLILIWILQNLFMLVSTSYRNNMYIEEYTLTYKRIGVYVWLCLAFIGLIITAIKVHKNKSNWYLVKTNVALWFTVLTLSSAVDWDLTITRYNLKHKSIQDIDYYYLFGMSDTNIPEMLQFCIEKAKTEKAGILKEGQTREQYYSNIPIIYEMRYKIRDYIINRQNDWRSWDLRDDRIAKSLNLK